MKKIILITGSNKGIGFETAKQLGKLGHTIILSARNNERLNQAILILKDAGIDVIGLLMDIGNEDSIKKAAGDFSKLNLALDVIINNAATFHSYDRSLLHEKSIIEETLRVNSIGALKVAQNFHPYMKNPSRIINISSGGGSMSDPVGGWSPAYCVSKSLLNAITRHLAYELQDKNISVNAVCPGWVQTDMGGASATRTVQKGAETPVWLATEASQKLTGKFFRDMREIPW